MTDNKRATQLGTRGLDLWGKGQLLEAADCFREAISITERSPYDYWRYHGCLGGVLSALGEDDDALAAYVEALAVVTEFDGDDASTAVAVSRYFLAER